MSKKIMVLKINTDLFLQDFVKHLSLTIDKLIIDFWNEATTGMTNEEKNDVEIKKAQTDIKTYIRASISFHALAIMRSFGTGSLMDRSSNYFEKYITSQNFNQLRQANNYAITGRPKDEYINIFGEKVSSTGSFEGQNLENFFKPIQPTYGIQQAEQWLKQENGKINRVLTVTIQTFVQQNMKKYFYNTYI